MNSANNAPDAAARIEDTYPLSPLQQGLLFHTLLAPGSGVDIEQLLCELNEALDVAAFRRAWDCVVARHPVLRTNLRWENLDEPRQEVHARVALPWEEQDWRSGGDRDRQIAEFLAADRRRGFDLARAPLFRLTLLRWGDAEYRLIWTFHHAVLEGRSYMLALREVFAYYEAIRHGAELILTLPRPYRDYIDWARQQDFSKDEAFWRETLQGFTAPTPLIVDHAAGTRPDGKAGHGTREVLLSAQNTFALRALARESEVTLNTVVQAAWALLLSRYSGETDIVFGVIRANRRSTIDGAQAMVGLFLNTLPLRLRVNPEKMLPEWLREVRRQWMAMRAHEHTPLSKVQGWSEVPRGSALFQSTLMFENYDLDAELRKQGGAWSSRRFHLLLQTNYLLDVAACDGTELRLTIDFDRGRIDDTAADRMLGHLRTLLESIACQPQRKLAELPLLDAAERHQLLVEWNQTAAQFPRGSRVDEMFEAQADMAPQAVAVTFDDRHLTYRELNRHANQLAHRLHNLGVGPDVPVGICAERSLEMIVGVLGILKAGGAYVPVDPTYPAERIEFMLRDIDAPVVLAQQALIPMLPALTATQVVSLDEWSQQPPAGDTGNPARAGTDQDLAYIIYTSGSTGQPKGAMVPHRAIVNHIRWMQATFPLDHRDRVLQKTEFSFDVSAWEIFAPLLAGAQLVLARSGASRDPVYLAEMIQRHEVTNLQLVPSLLRLLLETREFRQCRSLRHVFCGGEPMTADIPRHFFATLDAELHNMYGPTETAIDAVYYSVPRDYAGAAVPIGRPIANTRAYVLNDRLQPVPIGVAGELHLGGTQVGRGYYRQPGLTAERFIADVFSDAPNALLYKTGDRARFLPDGNLQLLGRTDNQVKIRGFRIELGEIEAALLQHPAVHESVAVAREGTAGSNQLVAYVTPAGSLISIGELRAFLKQKLPAHMIPSAIFVLAALPLAPNGKLDSNALPLADAASLIADEPPIAPRTPTEEVLAASWRKALKLDRIGVRDNFFDLGGHSLLVVSLISDIHWALKIDISVPDFFQNPTVEMLARVIDEMRLRRGPRPAVVQLQQGRAAPPVYFVYAGPDEFRLAQLMGEGRSVFGIDVRLPLAWRHAAATNRQAALPTLEQLAAPYADALSAHARTAPCVLAGHSFAGLIAFEAAHQLQKTGGNVDMVVLFDTWARYPSASQIAWHSLRDCWKQLPQERASRRSWPEIAARLRRSLSIVRRWLAQQAGRLGSLISRRPPDPGALTTLLDEEGVPLPGGLMQRLYVRIEDSYRPRRLNSRGVLFRADSRDDKKSVRHHESSLGWQNLFARGLEVRPTAGDHLSMIREHNSALARELNEMLDRHWPIKRDEAGAGKIAPPDA